MTSTSHSARNHLAGSDAGMNGQRRLHRPRGGVQCAGGPYRPFRIIGMGDGRAEYRHHRITDMFVYGAAKAYHRVIGNREKAI